MSSTQKGLSNGDENEDRPYASTLGLWGLLPGEFLPAIPLEPEGTGDCAGGQSQDLPQKAWNGLACVLCHQCPCRRPSCGGLSCVAAWSIHSLGEKGPSERGGLTPSTLI